MAKYGYSIKEINENMAKAVGRSLPISTKHCMEICNFIRNKELEKAKSRLEKVIGKKIAIPFRKIKRVAHKKGIGPGRYPIKASKWILNLLNEVEANAQYKGLSGNLKIVHICAQKASTPWHFGRKRRRKMKRTNVEVVVEEIKKEEKKKEVKESEKKEIKETKREAKKKTGEKVGKKTTKKESEEK